MDKTFNHKKWKRRQLWQKVKNKIGKKSNSKKGRIKIPNRLKWYKKRPA